MANMKAKLRPHRETKVKNQIKSKSINIKKAKEKVALKKTSKEKIKAISNKRILKNVPVPPPKAKLPNKPSPAARLKPKRAYRKREAPEPKGQLSKRIGHNGRLQARGTPDPGAKGKSKVRSDSPDLGAKLKSKVSADAQNSDTKPKAKEPTNPRDLTSKAKSKGPNVQEQNWRVKLKECTSIQDLNVKVKSKDSPRDPGRHEEKELPNVSEQKTKVHSDGSKPESLKGSSAAAKNVRKSSENAASKPRPYKCEECGKAFLGKNDLRKHSLIHSGQRPHVCEHCNKEFRQAGNLRNHISSYHSNVIENPKVFICDHCNKTFLIKERLRLHLRIHTGQKPYSCELCSMRFARMGQLRQHERTHTGERNFICVHCEATFTCGAKLRLHIKGHFDIRDYTCYLCGKSFIRPDAIKKHLACFHNGEKPFKCPLCEKSLKGHLQEHLRTHRAEKPHGCAECGSRFAQRSQLTVHQRKHSGARPYRCRVCWKAFAHSTALTLHTRHHTGEKPFVCRICSAPFAQLPHMKKHMRFVHGDGRAYSHPACGDVFHTKSELEMHRLRCGSDKSLSARGLELSAEERLSRQIADAYGSVEPPMALTKMRLLLAVLLKKISSNKRLHKLGFNKRLIDDILIESLESSGHTPFKDEKLSTAENLKLNVQLFLEWTVPPHFMAKFRNEQKSTEELLEELTS